MNKTLFFNLNTDLCKQNSNYGMLHYLENFDPNELKYSVFSDKIFYNGSTESKSDHPIYRSTVSYDALQVIEEYDSIFRMSELTKESYSYIKENLLLVYGDQDVVENDIKVFHYTEKKIIHEYLAIPQLDKMFDEDYFNFEWDMHVGQNFNEHRNDYYRDHFVHQVRDMYSMLVLLGRYGIYEGVYDALFDKTNGKIPKYTRLKLEEFMHKRQDAYIVTRNIHGRVKTRTEELLRKLSKNSKEKERLQKRIETKKAYSEAYFKKYVIYASGILSALFHDMGYPICHFLEVRHRISNYNPTMYMFTHNAIDSFDTIASKLGDSLLFTIISNQEIQDSLKVNKKGRFDHGAYSAIAFLLQFYNNGLIFSLPVEKQCAIELAAVAIYNHTREYKVMDPNVQTNYFQPVFAQNPMSFLLRLCDDLQEWDRRYFEISTESDYLICSKCLMPLLYKKIGTKTGYYCACSEEGKEFLNSSRHRGFLKRKMFLVTTSDLMISELVSAKDSQDNLSDKKILYFRIDYDLFKLLTIARINCAYAAFRLKELNDIKKLLRYQVFREGNNNFDFDYIYIDYFMTSNPILIKIKILEKFFVFNYLHKKENETKYNIPAAELIRQLENDTIEMMLSVCKIDKQNSLYQRFTHPDNKWIFDFYRDLLKRCVMVRNKIKTDVKKEAEELFESYIGKAADNVLYCDTLSELIYDCLYQYSKETIIDENGFIPEDFISEGSDYYHQYQYENDIAKELLGRCVNTYCNMENDFNRYKDFMESGSNKYIGYFADLALFEILNDKVREEHMGRVVK